MSINNASAQELQKFIDGVIPSLQEGMPITVTKLSLAGQVRMYRLNSAVRIELIAKSLEERDLWLQTKLGFEVESTVFTESANLSEKRNFIFWEAVILEDKPVDRITILVGNASEAFFDRIFG